jgi:hypothetical protein
MKFNAFAVAVVLVLVCVLHFGCMPAPITFADVQDAHRSIEAAGFCCASDRADGKIVSGFLISREPVSGDEIRTLRKVGSMGPEWKGKVWLLHLKNARSTPDDGGVRVWGDVLAIGDNDLLNEIESALSAYHGS